jgi:hypothetical protein
MSRFVVCLFVTACGSGAPGSPSPAPGTLAHSIPPTNPLVYSIADTTAISMNMQGQSMQIDAMSVATLALTYGAMQAGAIPVTVEYRSVEGRFTNPMSGSTALSPSDVPGPASLTVTATGDVTIGQVPQMTPAALQVLGTESTLKRLFQPVPGRAVTPGTTWTDTVSTVDENAGLRASTTSIIRSTLTGDTTIAGRSLRVIRVESDVSTQVAGSTQGFEIRQDLTGTSRGTAMWDPQLGALAQRTEIVSLSGTMAMPAMGMTGIPVSYESRQAMHLERGAAR